MVSTVKRHLSLLLVVVITSSLLLPNVRQQVITTLVSPAKAQTDDELIQEVVDQLGAQDNSDPCTVTNAALGDSATILFNGKAVTFRGLPAYQHRCFVKGTNDVIHRFRYDANSDIQSATTVFEQKFTKVTNLRVFGGCANFETRNTSDECKESTPALFTAFSVNKVLTGEYQAVPIPGDGTANDAGTRTTTYTSRPIDVYQITGAAEKNVYLLAYQNIIYGIFRQQGDRMIKFDIRSPKNYLEHYISVVNAMPAAIRTFGQSTAADGAGGTNAAVTASTVQGVKTLFGKLTNSWNTTLGKGGDFQLVDNPDATDKVNPEIPPILRIRGQALQMDQDLVFKLVFVLTSKGTLTQRNNNYFLFSIVESALTNKQREIFNTYKIDPKLVYVAIDVGANIGFLVEDKNKSGGIFSEDQDRLDPSNADNLIAIGSFDSGNVNGRGLLNKWLAQAISSANVSKNTSGQPLTINLQEYRDTITTRVYNEPDISWLSNLVNGLTLNALNSTVDAKCGKVVNYKERNVLYGDSQFADVYIPIGGFRKCINEDLNGNGWLKQWKVLTINIDNFSKNDECIQAFKDSGFIGNSPLIASTLCGMINGFVSAAMALAGFAVELLMEAVGLQ